MRYKWSKGIIVALALMACNGIEPRVSSGGIVQTGGATLFTVLSPQPYINVSHTEPSVFFPGGGRTVLLFRTGNDLRRYHNDNVEMSSSGIVDNGASTGLNIDLPSVLESPNNSKRYLFYTGAGQDLNCYYRAQDITDNGIDNWTAGTLLIAHTTNAGYQDRMYNFNPLVDPVDPTIIHLWVESSSQSAWDNQIGTEGWGYGNSYTRIKINADNTLTEQSEYRTNLLFLANHSNPIYDPVSGKILFLAHKFMGSQRPPPNAWEAGTWLGNDGYPVCDVHAYVMTYGDNVMLPASYRHGSFRIVYDDPDPMPSIADSHLYQFPSGQGFTNKLLLVAVPSVGDTDYRPVAWVSNSTITQLINEVEATSVRTMNGALLGDFK